MTLKKYKPKVRQILSEKEKARNDDGYLIAWMIARHAPQFVQKDVDGDKSVKLKDLAEITTTVNFETIRRTRQIIQNDNGEFPPTDKKILEARGIKEKNWRDSEVREARNYKPDQQGLWQ